MIFWNKGDNMSIDKPDLIPEEELLKPIKNTNQYEKNKTDEALDKECEEIAQNYILDLKKYPKPLPIRFCFTGLLEKTYENGFKKSSFVLNKHSNGLDFYRSLSLTKNEMFSQNMNLNIERMLSNDNSFLSNPKQILQIKKYFPEIFKQISMSIKKETGIVIDDADFNDYGMYLKYRNIIKKYTGKNGINFYDIESIKEKYFKDIDSEHEGHVNKIISNIFFNVPIKKWEFELQEFFLNNVIFKEAGEGYKDQFYDMAIVIDANKIEDKKEGFLPGIEQLITAKPDSILGLLYNPEGGYILGNNYLVEKAKRIFKKNPQLSRPIYNDKGEVLWPINEK